MTIGGPLRFIATFIAKYCGATGWCDSTLLTNVERLFMRRNGFVAFSAPIVDVVSGLRCAPQSDPAPCAGSTTTASGRPFSRWMLSNDCDASSAGGLSSRSGLPMLPTNNVSPVNA